MKKKVLSLIAMTMLMASPVAMTSCDDDDANTIAELLTQLLLQSTDELANTAWLTADNLHGIEFGSSSNGVMVDGDTGQVVERQFTYTMKNDENGGTTLTFTFTDGSPATSYAVMAYTAKSNISLRNNTTGVTLTYIYQGN